MKKRLFFILLLSPACATINSDPNILSTEPYNKVQYISNPSKGYDTLNTVEVVTKGEQANILNTIPKLYERVLADSKDRKVNPVIGNIKFSSYTKKEPYEVSYQDCHTETTTESRSNYSCTGYGTNQHCSTTYTSVPVSKQVCVTKYRTEERIVLYQRATGDVLEKRRSPSGK